MKLVSEGEPGSLGVGKYIYLSLMRMVPNMFFLWVTRKLEKQLDAPLRASGCIKKSQEGGPTLAESLQF